MNRDFSLPTARGPLRGQLTIPPSPPALVLLAQIHGTPADMAIAAGLALRHYALLSMPLLTLQETYFPDSAHNVPLLAQRLVDILDLLGNDGDTEALPVGLFATAHVTPAAIRAGSRRDAQVRALACHGGLVDQAGLQNLHLLAAPLLMLADADDLACAASFQRAAPHLSARHEFVLLRPAENPGSHVAGWFGDHLKAI